MLKFTTSFPGSLPVAGRRVERKVKGPEKFVGGGGLLGGIFLILYRSLTEEDRK